MSAAACLLLYSFTVAVLGPRLLTRLTHAGVAPRLGVAAWLAAIGSVLASWAAAAGFLLAELLRDWNKPGQVISSCFAAWRSLAAGRSGVLVQSGLLTLTLLAAGALAILIARLAQSLVHTRARTQEHARMARLVGRPMSGQDTVVLEAPERLAYCVAGRPDTIVITSAALDALDEPHLSAVLTHERAHLTGRHHLLLAFTRGLAMILPRVELFTTGASEIARLLEMWADDTAARAHGPRTVLGALLALSGAATVPAGALGATGTSVLARAERFAVPPGPAHQWRMTLLLTAVAVVLLAGPLVTGLLAATGLTWCSPMTG